PQVPPATVVVEVLQRDGNVLPRRRRPAGQGEHQHLRVREKGIRLPGHDLADVRLESLIRRDWDLSPEVSDGLDLTESVIRAESCVGVKRDDAAQQFFLRRLRALAGGLENGKLAIERPGEGLA